ncbi:MAG: glycosyltransferase family 4 protein [Verrucomicrobiae bacterium]|nr:glycosyltransferase family 4 protein [Verrucomicrobiae bacterium]
MPKRVAIDITPLLTVGTGIARATRSLLEAMVGLAPQVELVGVGRRLLGPPVRLPVRAVRLRLPRLAEPMIRRLRLIEWLCPADLYHATDFYLPLGDAARAVATVHDLFFLTDPEPMVDHERLRQWAPEFIRCCRAVIAISEFTKRELVRVLGVRADKIHVVHLGVDHSVFRPVDTKVERPYFFAVSCSTGRKNTPMLLRAYAELAKQNPRNDLVLAWDPPSEIRAKFGSHPRIRFIGRQGDDALRKLYSGATAVVYPSLREGFGLPVLEAMACGAPVITSNTTSLPEVGGEAAVYVDPNDEGSLVAALRAFDEGMVDRVALRDRGLKQAARFSWQRCATETLALYERLLR